jgi:outer membrane receptor protein involved in Fe transport
MNARPARGPDKGITVLQQVPISSGAQEGLAHRTRSPRTTIAGLLAFTSAIALSSGAAWAQAPSAPAAPVAAAPGAAAVQEVVVTAQKRTQNLQAVPISITALSNNDIAAAKVSGLDDLSRIVPALSFDTSASVGTTNVSIRGISSQAGAATVGLYIDDVSVTTKNFFYEGAVEPILPDLDRIEVLRGPQGTLYGDSSEGGTIRFLAQTPSMTTFRGEASAETSNTYGGGQNYAGSATATAGPRFRRSTTSASIRTTARPSTSRFRGWASTSRTSWCPSRALTPSRWAAWTSRRTWASPP